MSTYDDFVAVEVFRESTLLPQPFPNTVFLNLQDVFNEVCEDENGMVTSLGSFPAPVMYNIQFRPYSFCPPHICWHLEHFIPVPRLCEILSEHIASKVASLPEPLHVSVYGKIMKEVRIRLPAIEVVPRKRSNGFQRLLEEQKVDLIDLGEEEKESSCSICMEELLDSSSGDIVRMPKCLHLFHDNCIVEWLKHWYTCPLCRTVPYDEEDDFLLMEL